MTLKQTSVKDPIQGLTPDQVKQAIVSTATPMTGYSAFAAGAGYINAFAATNSVSR